MWKQHSMLEAVTVQTQPAWPLVQHVTLLVLYSFRNAAKSTIAPRWLCAYVVTLIAVSLKASLASASFSGFAIIKITVVIYIYIYMCVCVCVCVFVCIYTYIHTYIHIYIYIYRYPVSEDNGKCAKRLMSDWVAAPAVAVRFDSWSTGSVAVLTGLHVHAWLCRCCCCRILSSALSPGGAQVFSLLPACLDPCFDGEPPTVAVCSCSLPAFWVDVACLQISFANVFVSKDRPSCKSSASSKLSTQHFLRNSTIFHAA